MQQFCTRFRVSRRDCITLHNSAVNIYNSVFINPFKEYSRNENLISVNSFDIFDTIIARDVRYPHNIFDIIEASFPFENFKSIRMYADQIANHTFDDIYNKFQQLTNVNDSVLIKLKQYELDAEFNHTYIIDENYNKIQDGDILVSDMYFSSNTIRNLLNSKHFNKSVNIYVSSNGKYLGWMWQRLRSIYDIKLHLGDNHMSDVIMAYQNGIPSEYSNTHEFSPIEDIYMELIEQNEYKNNKSIELFALMMRRFRHLNPYQIKSREYYLYNDQIQYNIPLLLLIAKDLLRIAEEEQLERILLITRDGCLLQKIFVNIFNNINVSIIRFESSRILNRNPSKEYKEYIKQMYKPGVSIIFDINGGTGSSDQMYLDIFNFYPRIYLFNYINTSSAIANTTRHNSNLTFRFQHRFAFHRLETFNYDVVGPLVKVFMEEDHSIVFMRSPIVDYNIRSYMHV